MMSTDEKTELTPKQEREARDRVARLARLLDEQFRIPGTEIRFGWEALIGLIPGIGDLAGLVLGLAILEEARRLGAPGTLRLRMGLNLLLDLLLGAIPFAGDVLDLFFKANRENARLTLLFYDEPARAIAEGRRGLLRWVLALAGLITLLLGGVLGGLSLLFP
jgi:hypothetical protein